VKPRPPIAADTPDLRDAAAGAGDASRPDAGGGRQERDLAGDLRDALRERRLELAYQPQIRLPARCPAGVEALLRWCHPRCGPIETEAVIALAERSGQIGPLGEWALAEACAAAAAWPPARNALRIAVNISATQLRGPGFRRLVAGVLERTGLAAGRLELELTETMTLADAPRVAAALGELRELGVGLALDDFGTGYASLSHLRLFPLDAVKIDRSFVAELDHPAAAAIVRSLIELGHRLGLRVIAEGVESEAQLAVLEQLCCDEAQGHGFGRPLAAGDLPAWPAARVDVE